LRGHLGPVESMTFAPARDGKPVVLVSAAREWDGKNYAGAIRVWNAADGKEIDNIGQQPAKATRPGLAAWHTGDGLKQVRVAFAWDDGEIRLWDVGQDQLWHKEDGKYNIALAYLTGQGKVVSGGFPGREGGNVGRLRPWDVRPGAELRMDDKQLTIPPADGGHFFPRAMT